MYLRTNARANFFLSTHQPTDTLCHGYLSGFAFHSFVVNSSEITVSKTWIRFENVHICIHTHTYIKNKKELSNAKNRVELEILSFLSPLFLPSLPFSKWPPERKQQMAWRISRSTGNYQVEGIPWVIKRTLLFPAEKRVLRATLRVHPVLKPAEYWLIR